MPGASYINFNAGAQGPAMIEGRISSSAFIGRGTDVGGGARLLGVLSGGNEEPIIIGEDCLLGANSVTGICLGDGCIVDAGIAVLAGTLFTIDEEQLLLIKEVNPHFDLGVTSVAKGSCLSGLNGLHFRQDSKTGRMLVKRSTKEVKLNNMLHQ